MTKQQAISAMILNEMQANGGDLRAAFDKVMGEGASGSVGHRARAAIAKALSK